MPRVCKHRVKNRSDVRQDSSWRLKTIAHAAQRSDQMTIDAQFASDGGNVDVHRTFRDIGVFSTHGIDDLIARAHPPRTARQ